MPTVRIVRPLNPHVVAELDRIARDRTEGARSLGLRTLTVLLRECDGWRGRTPDDVRRGVRALSTRLRGLQPGMGQFRRWAYELERRSRSAGPLRSRKVVVRWLREERRWLEREPQRVASRAAGWLARTPHVVTISRSSTVSAALRTAARHDPPPTVLALVSEPGGEGRAFARELRSVRVPARAVPDRRRAAAARTADAVVVGADAVEPSGAVVHKVGTYRLAVEARRAGIPFVVLAGSSKWAPALRAPRLLPPRFDRTPRHLVSFYVSDRAVTRGGRARAGPPGGPGSVRARGRVRGRSGRVRRR